MTCRDLMTAAPACCLSSDSAATAAQIMKREDVGPVLVVNDHTSQQLTGIVTDRDLALKIVAEGRDPHNTRVDEVMSRFPVTCRTDDDVSSALKAMAENQVRRLPIIDDSGRLAGIISQADIARTASEEQVGELVEEISQPFGSGEWSESSDRTFDRAPAMTGASALAVGALCVGVGAGLMFLFDPSRGRRRRAVIRDKAVGYAGSSAEALRRARTDLEHRAAGAYAATKSRFAGEEVDDDKLQLRVRSKMGHVISNPHAVEVRVSGGHVSLSGPVLVEEATRLLGCVRAIPGVQSVENLLEVHDRSENHPSLQATSSNTNGLTPVMRLLTGAVGGGLMLYGLKSRTGVGKATAGIGLGLLTRGLANREFGRLGDIASLRFAREN